MHRFGCYLLPAGFLYGHKDVHYGEMNPIPRAIVSRFAIPVFVCAGLAIAGAAALLGHGDWAQYALLATLVIGSVPLLLDILDNIRRLHFGVDIIAIVAIVTSLVVGQYLAGTIILLMLSGGEALEQYALRRARKDLTDLIARAPQTAHKQLGSAIRDVPVEEIAPGDLLLVKPGETIPVDGEVTEGTAMVDESAITGEPLPVEKWKGASVMSGSISEDAVLTIRALRPSAESRYAHIIRLVREAERQKAPFVRLADRHSVRFTAATFVLALLAWFLSHDPLRLLAVLVVATPCPLILATPIAFAAGISRAAKRGIIVRSGGAIEKLGEARSFVFDKTGTLTLGIPLVTGVEAYALSCDDILSLAASLDQLSAHVLARALVYAARSQRLPLLRPDTFHEEFGQGVRGRVNGKEYLLGRLSYLESQGVHVSQADIAKHDRMREKGDIVVYLAGTRELLGAVFLSDQVRDNVRELFGNLRQLDIEIVRMLTGDKRAAALEVATQIGLQADDVHAECLPEQKVAEVERLRKHAGPVVMVGDGINDAPAIAAADVGIAMGVHGFSASSEAGDIIITVDQIERVGEALCIGHRVLDIARQSIYVGIGLSLLLMVLAAFGYIVLFIGAMLQEVIDVLGIVNALRVLFVDCSVFLGKE